MLITGETLRIARVSANLTGVAVATKYGCSRGFLSEVELCHRVPDQEELLKISHAIRDLVEIKTRIRRIAIKAGWPASEAIPA